MSKRRKVGDWVWLKPNSGFVGESHKFRAEIQPENEPISCWMVENCDDPECKEWMTLWTEETKLYPNRKFSKKVRYPLYHVSECQMLDKPWRDDL